MVMQGREKGQKTDDPVDKEVGRALEALDKACKPAPLPKQVTAELAKSRIAGLIAEKPADPLPVLLETRFYVTKGLLTDNDMQQAAVSLLGEIEYAQLIASSPDGEMTQAIGSAISLPGMIELMRGVNTATGASARAKARRERDAANPGEGQPPRARGCRREHAGGVIFCPSAAVKRSNLRPSLECQGKDAWPSIRSISRRSSRTITRTATRSLCSGRRNW
jgi:hypothetical protein